MLNKSINHSYFYQLYVYLYVLYNTIEYNYINRRFIKLASFYDEQTNSFVADDTNKADMLNKYFGSQCSLDETNHDLPPMHHTHTNSLQSIHQRK